MEDRACVGCGANEQDRTLTACPVCKKPFCFACTWQVHGKNFCSKGCGSFFFFGEGEDETGADAEATD